MSTPPPQILLHDATILKIIKQFYTTKLQFYFILRRLANTIGSATAKIGKYSWVSHYQSCQILFSLTLPNGKVIFSLTLSKWVNTLDSYTTKCFLSLLQPKWENIRVLHYQKAKIVVSYTTKVAKYSSALHYQMGKYSYTILFLHYQDWHMFFESYITKMGKYSSLTLPKGENSWVLHYQSLQIHFRGGIHKRDQAKITQKSAQFNTKIGSS